MATPHDPLASMRAEAQERQQQQDQALLTTQPHDGPPPAPTATFSTSNDDALAAHLKQTRDSNAAYLKLQSEDARKQFEAEVASNFRRDEAQKQEGAIRGQMEREQSQIVSDQKLIGLLAHAKELHASIPTGQTLTEWNAPMNLLADYAKTMQELDAAAKERGITTEQLTVPQPQAQQRPETFPDGSLYQFNSLADGQVELNLITGETFKGTAEQVIQKVADSSVHTKLWARRKVEEAQLARPTDEPVQPVQQIVPPEPTQQSTIADYWADQTANSLAKQFGFSDKNELMQWGEEMTQLRSFKQEYDLNRSLMDFSAKNPDFPATNEAISAVGDLMQANGWQVNAENLSAAHALAVQRKLYQPIDPQDIQPVKRASVRPLPPPMLRGGSPEASAQEMSPYSMSMDELKKMAIRQQLEREGPRV